MKGEETKGLGLPELCNSLHLSDKLELTQSHFGKVQAHERKAM